MVIDVIFVVFVFWGFYFGFFWGIIKMVFMIFLVVFGLMIVFCFGLDMMKFLEFVVNDNVLMFLVGFLFIFVLMMVIICLFVSFLEGVFEFVNINFIN